MTENQSLVEVANFQQAIEAEIVCGRLQSEGIEAFIQDEHSISLRPYLAQALGGVKVQVMKKDLEAALKILAEFEKPDPAPSGPPCPSCSSENTAVVKNYSLKSLFNIFIFPIAFSLYRKSHHCRDCGADWR